MFRLSLLLLTVYVGSLWVVALDEEDTQPHWDAFKEKYNKTYDSPEEEDEARNNFEKNLLHVALHNVKDDEEYDKDLHQYSDMSEEEQREVLCGTDLPLEERSIEYENFSISERDLPASKNWVDEGMVSEVRDQGSCGSCWAFTAAQALESQANMRWSYGKWVISPQQLVDCSSDYGNNGCNGGWPQDAFDYIKNEGGLCHEVDYPYTAEEGTCSVPDKFHFTISDYKNVGPAGDENAVANALAEHGPLTTAIYVSNNFMHYSSGVFTDSSYRDQEVNHGVVLVGYGNQDGQAYWLVKNSWGTDWGEGGYIKIRRNYNNHLKVASYTSYPII